MRVVSVNVSLPKTVEWRGRKVTTAIFKEPVEGRVRIRRTLSLLAARTRAGRPSVGIVR